MKLQSLQPTRRPGEHASLLIQSPPLSLSAHTCKTHSEMRCAAQCWHDLRTQETQTTWTTSIALLMYNTACSHTWAQNASACTIKKAPHPSPACRMECRKYTHNPSRYRYSCSQLLQSGKSAATMLASGTCQLQIPADTLAAAPDPTWRHGSSSCCPTAHNLPACYRAASQLPWSQLALSQSRAAACRCCCCAACCHCC
jgi:hypothetical protein